MSGEMLTAMFAGITQVESESISGNMRWSYQTGSQKISGSIPLISTNKPQGH